MTFYDLQILDGVGWANGINDSGQVVGIAVKDPLEEFSTAWWRPDPDPAKNYKLEQGPPLQLFRVNNAGDATGEGDIGHEVFNINTKANIVTLPNGIFGFDINNAQQVVGNGSGGGAICDLGAATVTPLPPLPGQNSSEGRGINNNGDVVGGSGNRGFFYSAADGQPHDVGECFLEDINDHKLAVGRDYSAPFTSAVWINLSQVNNPKLPPILHQIQLPRVQPVSVWWPYHGQNHSQAMAVNSGGTIVGYGGDSYPFVYQFGQQGPAADLNNLILPSSEWYLVDALDINDAGQIVGTALGPRFFGGFNSAAYIATPRPAPNFAVFGLMVKIIAGVIQGGGGITSPGGPQPPPQWFSALPPEQREALLSFAISNLADLMSDREARSQIQRIAGEAASRALGQSKPLHGLTLSPAQKEQMAKARNRILRR